jgi:hypothetical protein
MSNVNISGYIVPWVLPNEKIPMHVTWTSDVFFDKIRVRVPPELKIDDILNVDEAELTENGAIITKVKLPIEGVPCYFGMVMSAPKILEKLKTAKEIKIEFIRSERVFYCLELYSRIFRPRLEISKYPEEIVLSDYSTKNKLPLNLKYVGFGDIELKIEAKIAGKIVSIGESIVYELMRRLWLSDVLKKKMEKTGRTLDKEKERQKKELWVEPAYVRKMAQELQEKIDKGEIPTAELDPVMVAELKEWLTDIKAKDKFMQILYEKTEELLLSLLLDLFERNPTNSVTLANAKTVIRTQIKAPVTELNLKLLYRDKIGNDYLPIEIRVPIIDKRTKETGMFIEIPILIEKWEDEPFMNVAKMKFLEGR